MPTAPKTALITTGPLSDSWVSKLPGLRNHLRFVKAHSLRVASRIANTLRSGVPVEHYDDLRQAELVLISVPPDQVAPTVEELRCSTLPLARHAVVICGSHLDTQELLPLRNVGAVVGSLDLMDGFDEKRFLFEGDRGALLRLRRLVEKEGSAKIVEMEARRRAVYEAGLTFAGAMTFQMIAAGVEAMRSAGLKDKQAEIAVESAVLRALRAYMSAGRRGWVGPLAEANRAELSSQYQGLLAVNPDLAEVFLKIALDYLVERGPELAKSSRDPAPPCPPPKAPSGSRRQS